jgi:Cysteine-rich secretory protein family
LFSLGRKLCTALLLAGNILIVGPCLAQSSTDLDQQQSMSNGTDISGIERHEPVMSLDQARSYMLTLINRDRAAHGVGPVRPDPIATKAAQWHSDAMAKLLFNSHWHTDGKKPQQRYTECGGMDYDAENSHGALPQSAFQMEVAPEQSFTASEIEKEEECYFNEVPPNDGHRKNILDPTRTHVGLGLTLLHFDGGPTHYRQLTSSQEFVNRYGNYSISATEMQPNVPFVLTGQLQPPFEVYEVQVKWEKGPELIPLDTLRSESGPFAHGYGNPTKDIVEVFPVSYGQKPNAHLMANGNSFRCEILPERNWKPGLYYLVVWVKPGSGEPVTSSQIVVPLAGK